MSTQSSVSAAVAALAAEYIEWDPNAECRDEIDKLLNDGNEELLNRVLRSRLAFGTAGLRGPMGAGYCKMNDLVILQTTQGLCKYLLAQIGDDAKEKGVVIGYDHRQLSTLSSLGFARICAAVFLSHGFKVYCLEGYVPTPFVAFATTHLGCAAGIMVTASHNPKLDNGFKMYWDNGSQIIPPHDTGIAAAIEMNFKPSQVYDSSNEGVLRHPNTTDITETVSNAYFNAIATLHDVTIDNAGSKIKVVYTAMHGVGYQWIKQAFQRFDHAEVSAVISQCEPDHTFATVAFPNPEEKGALNEAIKHADSVGATVIIANDPDADRLAVAEKNGNDWYTFSGNELGALLGYWQIIKYKNNKSSDESATAAVLASVVSSRMLKSIAQKEGIKYYDTLTGFKWLGNKAIELKAQQIDVLFSYEEALGFCVGNVIVDKDGVSGAAVFVEMINALAANGLTVKDQLNKLYNTYGEFVSYNSYYICHDNRKTDAIFERLRVGGVGGGYWHECAGKAIVAIKDVTKGYDSTVADGKSDLPLTPDSHMIMYEFSNGCTVTLRTSGTEPKIKFYTEMSGQIGQQREAVEATLREFVDQVVDDMLQPSKHSIARP